MILVVGSQLARMRQCAKSDLHRRWARPKMLEQFRRDGIRGGVGLLWAHATVRSKASGLAAENPGQAGVLEAVLIVAVRAARSNEERGGPGAERGTGGSPLGERKKNGCSR